MNSFPKSAVLFISIFLGCSSGASAQGWRPGFELGELPWNDSLKPGVNLTYQFSPYHQGMASYQWADAIQRDDTSFNSNAVGLSGLQHSKEKVGERWQLLGLWYPNGQGFYFSYGLVSSGGDTEQLDYDQRIRTIQGETISSDIRVRLTRRRAIEPAIGLGYRWQLAKDCELFVQWTGNLFEEAPEAVIDIQNDDLSESSKEAFRQSIQSRYQRLLTNRHHLFSLGMRF